MHQVPIDKHIVVEIECSFSENLKRGNLLACCWQHIGNVVGHRLRQGDRARVAGRRRHRLDHTSEPSTSLSLGHDVLEHLMPQARVPTLDLRSLRANSRNARHRKSHHGGNLTRPTSSAARSRSVKPPEPPPNHGLHQDFLLWPSNRPENYPHGGPNSFFQHPVPPRAPSSTGNAQQRAQRPRPAGSSGLERQIRVH